MYKSDNINNRLLLSYIEKKNQMPFMQNVSAALTVWMG